MPGPHSSLRSRPRAGSGLAAAALLAAIAASPARSAPARQSAGNLLGEATFIATTKDWWGTRFRCGIDIQWLSDTRLIHARFTGNYNPNILATRMNLRRHVYVRDTRTGREILLPGLTRAIDELSPEIVDGNALSPDGKWFLWSERWGQCLVAEVRGRRRQFTPADDDGCYRSVHWLPDSRRWMELFGSNGRTHHLVLHDVRRPGWARQLPIGDRRRLLSRIRHMATWDRAICLVLPWGDETDAGLAPPSVYEVGLRAGGPVRRIAVLRGPQWQGSSEAAVSPRGDALAWARATLVGGKGWRHEVWVSRLDGSHPRRQGALVERRKSADDEASSLELQWLPSGRRLAFVWDDRLYTVPVRADRAAGAVRP